MAKKEIARSIAEEVGLQYGTVLAVIQSTFDTIIAELASGTRGGRVELRGFGVFEVKERASRPARNPRTGEHVQVPRKFVATFKPGKEMAALVRQCKSDDPKPETTAIAAGPSEES